MKQKIKTRKELIVELGGTNSVMELTGVKSAAVVTHWIKRGFAKRHRKYLYDLAISRKINFDREIFL